MPFKIRFETQGHTFLIKDRSSSAACVYGSAPESVVSVYKGTKSIKVGKVRFWYGSNRYVAILKTCQALGLDIQKAWEDFIDLMKTKF